MGHPPRAAAAVTRRALLAAGAVALARPASAAAQDSATPETRALTALIARELAAALAYERSGMATFAAHEHDHAAALRPHLEALNQPLPRPGPVPAVRGEPEAVALEQELLRAYREALPALEDPATIRTAATIMASHGQHLVALRGLAALS